MKSKILSSKLTYRKLKLSDYNEFKRLFYFCFNKKVSFDFFKWRYFSNKFSFCFGVFEKSRLIANVGMISIRLNNNKKERIFSRHSSMVSKNYRGKGIFSDLLKRVKKNFLKNARIVVMWPNKNNFANFDIDTKKIIKKRYYLYKTFSTKSMFKKTKNFRINELNKLRNNIKSDNSFFFKNFLYFKEKYLSYQKQNYLINKFEFKKLSSFFIIKRNKDSSGLNYVIMDHFGSDRIKYKHLTQLIIDQNTLIFLSTKKINNLKYKLLNLLFFKIGFLKKINLKQEKNNLINKEIFLGDTDIFLPIGKN